MVSPMPTQPVILRHGQTEWSLSGQHTGLTDLPLPDEGRAQVASFRSRLAALEFERVISRAGEDVRNEHAAMSMLGWKRQIPVVLRRRDACEIQDEWCSHAVFPDV